MKIWEEDAILIKNLYLSKGYCARRLLSEFPDKGWKLGSIDTLWKKIRVTGTIDRQPGSGRPRSARVNENIENVEDLMFSLEDNPKTHWSIHEISRETSIRRSTVHRIIHGDLKLKWVERRHAQELSVSQSRRPSDSLQAASEEIQWSCSPLHMVYGWKSVYRRITIQLAERPGICASR